MSKSVAAEILQSFSCHQTNKMFEKCQSKPKWEYSRMKVWRIQREWACWCKTEKKEYKYLRMRKRFHTRRRQKKTSTWKDSDMLLVIRANKQKHVSPHLNAPTVFFICGRQTLKNDWTQLSNKSLCLLCCYFMMQQKFTCSWWWLQQEKKTGWGLTDSTLTSQHPSPPSVTHAPWGCSVVRAAYRQQYIMAPSCLKTIWKLLGYDPSGGWGLWVFGEHHVSQSQLYKLRAHAPQIQISSTQCTWHVAH